MNLEEQVVSLELAKKLYKLGVEQESLFYWINENGEEVVNGVGEDEMDKLICSAFTVAELGEMLTDELGTYKMNGKWSCCECWDGDIAYNEPITVEEDKEADARALLLIHLIEEKIIEP